MEAALESVTTFVMENIETFGQKSGNISGNALKVKPQDLEEQLSQMSARSLPPLAVLQRFCWTL